jgi:hypothetical protein
MAVPVVTAPGEKHTHVLWLILALLFMASFVAYLTSEHSVVGRAQEVPLDPEQPFTDTGVHYSRYGLRRPLIRCPTPEPRTRPPRGVSRTRRPASI